MRAFMMINKQTDGHGQRTDGARATVCLHAVTKTLIHKQTRTAGRATFGSEQLKPRSVENAYHAFGCMSGMQ